MAPSSHGEHAARAGVAAPCTAHHVNYGGGCLNCGWTPAPVNPRSPALDLASFEGFTPGPWIVQRTRTGHSAVYPAGSQERVADIYCPLDVAGVFRSDARLIAAAPALLAECVRQREVIADLRAIFEQIASGWFLNMKEVQEAARKEAAHRE